jgi:hypothetical protein
MFEKYYKFNDGHPTGGNSVVTITEPQILEHMRQFTDHVGLTDEQLIMKFTQDRKAIPIPTPACKNTKKTCTRDDKCCKNQVTGGFVPDSNFTPEQEQSCNGH